MISRLRSAARAKPVLKTSELPPSRFFKGLTA